MVETYAQRGTPSLTSWCSSDPECDGKSSRITLRASTIQDNFEQGWLGSGDDVVLERNRFLGNGTSTAFEHNIYWSNSQSPTFGGRIVGNELYRSAAALSGSCEGGTFVSHGTHTDLLIEGNWVHEDVGAALEGCWGITLTPTGATAEAFTGVVIRGNRVENLGNLAIGVTSCVDCTIENNVVVAEQPFPGLAIAAPAPCAARRTPSSPAS